MGKRRRCCMVRGLWFRNWRPEIPPAHHTYLVQNLVGVGERRHAPHVREALPHPVAYAACRGHRAMCDGCTGFCVACLVALAEVARDVREEQHREARVAPRPCERGASGQAHTGLPWAALRTELVGDDGRHALPPHAGTLDSATASCRAGGDVQRTLALAHARTPTPTPTPTHAAGGEGGLALPLEIGGRAEALELREPRRVAVGVRS
jgi:hypothetical protein